MISQRVRHALTTEVQRRDLSDGVLSAALFLYLRNFSDAKSSNPTFSDKKIEDLCILPTSVDSLVEAARRTFDRWSDGHQKTFKTPNALLSISAQVGIGVLSNIVFIVFSLLLISAAKEQVKSFLQSLGLIS